MPWPRESARKAREIEQHFKDNLREIADCLADHERASSVSVAHVERAFTALANSGLTRKRWIDRPDTETALGGLFVGAAFACPDVVNTLVDPVAYPAVAPAALIVFFCVGVFLFGHGTYRATLPSSFQRDAKRFWLRRIVMIVFAILAALALGNLILHRIPTRSTGRPSSAAQTSVKP